ncbi:CAAX amino terminal protease family protein [Pseudooceanicola batsensis HTCC2597]|uniref:CAAX amino terminal protease family protein n=1 Tax=Pseudooceanicola batsensis (strain ATCC BAA-863 / DSM 15984 / KCTC 12145 / HTCC2597) TaxID=252305 RepID=A3TVU4_PSEBH|nr:CPBP family intramembrane glutamic endopeptidase [Pseudooceanicola batsensis]EAQ03740.1 CAAX amino terminal protease family protein [Pseudooceanicola batsensis HTCC2597]
MQYDGQQNLSDRARPSAEIWRTVMGTALIVALSFVMMTLWIMIQGALSDRYGIAAFQPGATPTGLIWTLSTFLCPLLAMALVMHGAHRRSLWSLFGPADMLRRQFPRILGVQTLVVALALLLPAPDGLRVEQHLALARWLSWLPLALLMLAVQVAAEEVVFRGYLQSQLAARFRSPLIWIVMPAALFAVLHLDPTADGNRWPIVGVTFLFALAAGDLTARAGTLAPALALHFVNNFASLMVVGAAGQMEGMALYVFPVDMSDPALRPSFVLEALLILIAWLAARIVLRR